MAPLLHDAASPVFAQDSAEDLLAALNPTKTTGNTPTIVARQATATVTIIEHDGGGGGDTRLGAGAIAGIVIGSIVGFLLLVWIFRSCFNLGAPPQEREAWYNDVGEKPRRHRHRSRSRRVAANVSMPPPVVVRDRSRSSRRPSATYVYTEGDARRGRRHGNNY